MSEASQTIRQKVHALAEELPPDASWDDVIEEARFRRAVELGMAAADRGVSPQKKKSATPLPAGA